MVTYRLFRTYCVIQSLRAISVKRRKYLELKTEFSSAAWIRDLPSQDVTLLLTGNALSHIHICHLLLQITHTSPYLPINLSKKNK